MLRLVFLNSQSAFAHFSSFLVLRNNLSFSGFVQSVQFVLRLHTEFEGAQILSGSVIVELRSERFRELVEARKIFLANIFESNTSGGFLSNKGTELGFALNDAESDSLLSAELRKPDNKFDWGNIGSDDNKFSFVVFHKIGNVVKSIFEGQGFWSSVWFFSSFFGSSQRLQSSDFGGLVLWLVFLKNSV